MPNIHNPFHQKYRPCNLDELVGQEFISITLKQALISKKIAPAYLFNGPRGTGKTSSARIFAKSLNCQSFEQPTSKPCGTCDLCKQIALGNALDIIEIDAASNTGVENIREIIDRARFSPTQARWKVYVIDECHMLSTAASNALLKTIEEPPANVVFILATTNPERVLTTIQSRCQRFDFKRINTNTIFENLLQIANKESIKFEDQALKLIAKRSNGGMRDAQSLLDQLSLLPDGINKKNVQNLLGEVSENDLISLINSLIQNDPESLLFNCKKLYDEGNEPHEILIGLLNITRDLLLKNLKNDYSELYYTSKEFHDELNKFSKKLEKSTIISWHNNLKNVDYQIKNSDNPRLWLDIHLTSLININNNIENENKLKTINNIENENKLKTINNVENENKLKTINNVENENKLETINNVENENKLETINNIEYESSEIKAKWELILSKLELPSTKMLLSQQAELSSVNSKEVVIALSPNWENMIKSRSIIIENAVKKVFGDNIKINFTSKKSNINNSIISKEQITNTPTKSQKTKNLDFQNDSSSEESPQIKSFDNSPKNLANFFNGEIIDLDE